eukprot:1184461-Prorocentrum_minimum.AAC.3
MLLAGAAASHHLAAVTPEAGGVFSRAGHPQEPRCPHRGLLPHPHLWVRSATQSAPPPKHSDVQVRCWLTRCERCDRIAVFTCRIVGTYLLAGSTKYCTNEAIQFKADCVGEYMHPISGENKVGSHPYRR